MPVQRNRPARRHVRQRFRQRIRGDQVARQGQGGSGAAQNACARVPNAQVQGKRVVPGDPGAIRRETLDPRPWPALDDADVIDLHRNRILTRRDPCARVQPQTRDRALPVGVPAHRHLVLVEPAVRREAEPRLQTRHEVGVLGCGPEELRVTLVAGNPHANQDDHGRVTRNRKPPGPSHVRIRAGDPGSQSPCSHVQGRQAVQSGPALRVAVGGEFPRHNRRLLGPGGCRQKQQPDQRTAEPFSHRFSPFHLLYALHRPWIAAPLTQRCNPAPGEHHSLGPEAPATQSHASPGR